VAVTFSDTSTGGPTAWSWNFGDGTTSTLQNPSHAWSTAGTYTVSLIDSNANGSSNQATAQVVVTNDTTAPTTPGALTATANGQTEIDLACSRFRDDSELAALNAAPEKVMFPKGDAR